jgi:NADH dehydrogenase
MRLVPIFGDGTAKIQPIDVDDVVRFLLRIPSLEQVSKTTLELGGPEVMSIKDIIVKLRPADRTNSIRFVHLPARLTQTLLATIEPVLLPILPLTAGQIATFVNDGIAAPNKYQ